MKQNNNKHIHYLKLAAKRGDAASRHNLGTMELRAGRHDLAKKHFMMAAANGDKLSMSNIYLWYSSSKRGPFSAIEVTKEEYEQVLRAHQKSLDDGTSDARAHAARQSAHFQSDPSADNPILPSFMLDGTEPAYMRENASDTHTSGLEYLTALREGKVKTHTGKKVQFEREK